VEYVEKLRGTPPGTKKISERYLNRPETIESVFYMYRLTGDRKWQEKGWKMFVSWVETAKVGGGMSSIRDVRSKIPIYGDNMESFTFAETLKYHFLLQSEPDLISLDDYVLNTEAHPLLTAPTAPRLWSGPLPGEDLGRRAEGTDAQKWLRSGILHRGRRRGAKQDAIAGGAGGPEGPEGAGQGGGRGMGGGGGRPGMIPELPEEFMAKLRGRREA